MTEQEWLVSDEPQRMLRWYCSDDAPLHPVLSDRKLCLFACACRDHSNGKKFYSSAYADPERSQSFEVPGYLTPLVMSDLAMVWAQADGKQFPNRKVKADFLRDIFGNPFAKGLPYWEDGELWVEIPTGKPGRRQWDNTGWMSWNNGLIRKIASDIYDRRAFVEMPVLGDTLIEAGCTNKNIIWHCQGFDPCGWCLKGLHGMEQACGGRGYNGKHGYIKSGPHVRGCWVLDLFLGKE